MFGLLRMANIIPSRPRQLGQQVRQHFAVVASQFNETYVEGLVEHFRNELQQILPQTSISVYHVPGAFEIPLVVQELAAQGGHDAIVAFGVIIKGETAHADHLGQSITNALLDCSLRYRLPVIHEVLSVNNEQQAQARCLGTELNRGIEAARTAAAIAQTMAEFKPRQ
jgi:6,7-dimethyl-8-ribityllumazine synthase